MEENKVNENLASELLNEVRVQAKRWFIAFCVMVLIEAATIGVFVWYISLPIDDTTITQSSDGDGKNNVVGGDLYGSEADGKKGSESGASTADSNADKE